MRAIKPRALSFLALVLALLSSPAALAAPQHREGQNAERELSAWATSYSHPKFGLGVQEIGHIGYRDADDSTAPAQTLEMFYGKVALSLPAGEFAALGLSFRPLYSDSPASAFDDFGAEFSSPLELDSALNIAAPWPQWQHMANRDLFMTFPSRNPWSIADWVAGSFLVASNGAPATTVPLVGNTTGGAFLPTSIFSAIEPIADPPAASPTGGKLIGLNAVLQATVLDTNASTPSAPKLRLTNAIGIRAMVAPPIKIGLDGGNYGGRGSVMIARGEYISPTIGAWLPLPAGNALRLPTSQIDGESFAVGIPPAATTGVLQFNSQSGPGRVLEEQILVVTHGPVHDAATDSIPPIHSEVIDNEIVHGFSIVGTADQLGEVIGLVPPALLALFDLEIDVYPYDEVADLAGYGTGVNVAVEVTEVPPTNRRGTSGGSGGSGGVLGVATLPVPPVQPPTLTPIGTRGSVLELDFEDLTGEVEICFTTPNASTQRYLAVVRARAAN
jgi:hypothetical protein